MRGYFRPRDANFFNGVSDVFIGDQRDGAEYPPRDAERIINVQLTDESQADSGAHCRGGIRQGRAESEIGKSFDTARARVRLTCAIIDTPGDNRVWATKAIIRGGFNETIRTCKLNENKCVEI